MQLCSRWDSEPRMCGQCFVSADGKNKYGRSSDMPNKPIDYSVAGKWANYVRALAIVESGENEFAFGDDGRLRSFAVASCAVS